MGLEILIRNANLIVVTPKLVLFLSLPVSNSHFCWKSKKLAESPVLNTFHSVWLTQPLFPFFSQGLVVQAVCLRREQPHRRAETQGGPRGLAAESSPWPGANLDPTSRGHRGLKCPDRRPTRCFFFFVCVCVCVCSCRLMFFAGFRHAQEAALRRPKTSWGGRRYGCHTKPKRKLL